MSLRARSWTIFAGFVLSMCAFGIIQSTTLNNDIRASGQNRAEALAQAYATNFDDRMGRLRQLLERLGANPLIRQMGPRQCEPMPLETGATQIRIVDRTGTIVCRTDENHPSGDDDSVRGATYANRPWLTLRETGTTSHYTENSPPEGTAAVELVHEAGNNLVVSPVPVSVVQDALSPVGLDTAQTVTLVNEADRLVLASWPDTDVHGADTTGFVSDLADEPLHASAPLAGGDWAVHVVLDWEEASSVSREQNYRTGAAILAAVLLALGAMHLRHRTVRVPLSRLENDMFRALTDSDAQASTDGPRELAQVAHMFNTVVTSRNDAEHRLSAALARLAEQRDTEKRDLALQLHDSTLQQLVAISWFLDAWAAQNPGALTGPELEDLRQNLDLSIADLQRHSRDLMPGNVQFAGLEAALTERLRQVHRVTGASTGLTYHAPPLAAPVKTLVYRVAAEALTNASTHASPQHVQVDVRHDDDLLHVTVTDDGHESDESSGTESRDDGVGLVAVRESIRSAGGTFWTASVPGEGFTVRFTVPLLPRPLPPAPPDDPDTPAHAAQEPDRSVR